VKIAVDQENVNASTLVAGFHHKRDSGLRRDMINFPIVNSVFLWYRIE